MPVAYIQGIIIPVPAENKDAYLDIAHKAAPIFQEYGALRVVESWADDVPVGKVTDFRRAVNAKDDEAIVFSWIEWPDKATYQAASEKMQADPRWQDMLPMCFDGQRMIWAGFELILEAGS